jgi:hypothetical protein
MRSRRKSQPSSATKRGIVPGSNAPISAAGASAMPVEQTRKKGAPDPKIMRKLRRAPADCSAGRMRHSTGRSIKLGTA